MLSQLVSGPLCPWDASLLPGCFLFQVSVSIVKGRPSIPRSQLCSLHNRNGLSHLYRQLDVNSHYSMRPARAPSLVKGDRLIGTRNQRRTSTSIIAKVSLIFLFRYETRGPPEPSVRISLHSKLVVRWQVAVFKRARIFSKIMSKFNAQWIVCVFLALLGRVSLYICAWGHLSQRYKL